jgi:hypothetical protein
MSDEIPAAIREQARSPVPPSVALRLSRPAELQNGLAHVRAELRPIQEWLVEALSSRKALEAPLGEQPIPKLHALLAASSSYNAAALAVAVTRAHGLDTVLAALLSPSELTTRGRLEGKVRAIVLAPVQDGANAWTPHHVRASWLHFVISFFDAAGADDRARFRALAEAQRPALPLAVRAATSALFEERSWAEADAVALLATGPRRNVSGIDAQLDALLPYVIEDATFEALAKLAGDRVWYGGVCARLLVGLPPSKAVARILHLLEGPLQEEAQGDTGRIVAVLASSADPSAARGIARAALLAKEAAKAYFVAHPEHLPLLQAQAKGRGKRAEEVLALLEEMERQRHAAEPVLGGGARSPETLASPPWLTREPPWAAREVAVIADGERLVESKALEELRKSVAASARAPAATAVAKNGLLGQSEFAALGDEAALANIGRLKVVALGSAIARFGVRALPEVARAMNENPMKQHDHVLELVRSPRLAAVAWSFHRAEAWLLDDPGLSTLGLVPELFRPEPARRFAAEMGLLRLCVAGHRARVEASAARYGADLASAVLRILDRDPRRRLPDPLPRLAPALEDGSLPVLETPEGPLPASTIPIVGMLLAVSRPWFSHPGLVELREQCTKASRDAFSWELQRKTGSFDGIAHLGGDGAVRKLDALLSAKRQGMQPEVRLLALDALVRAGTPLALVLLQKHALLSPWRDRTLHIEARLDELARVRGTTRSDLVDAAMGELDVARELPLLDYGPRHFRVLLDDHILPHLRDESGQGVPNLPKPTRKDDAEKAARAKAQLEALTLDLDDVRETVLTFFERAMATDRTWDAERFERSIVRHPLLGNVAQRLVFTSGERLFRVAEDRTFADATDSAVRLAPQDRVSVAHPVHMPPAALERFRALFADYEIIQPFPQLERTTFRFTDAEREATKLTRFVGRKVATAARGRLLGGPGWQDDRGSWAEKPLGARRAVLHYSSLGAGKTTAAADELRELTLLEGDREVPFSSLSTTEASELLRDLESLPAP